MKKRLFAVVLVSALAVSMMTACGSSNTSSDTEATTDTAEATVSAIEETTSVDNSEAGLSAEAETTESKVIKPMDSEIDLNEGTYPASFTADSIVEGDNGLELQNVTFYTEDWYDIADIGQLQVGDTIESAGQTYTVESIEDGENGAKLINGGYEQNGLTFVTEEDSNGWRTKEDNDYPTYTEKDTTTLPISKDVKYTDNSDPSTAVTATYDDLASKISESTVEFNQYNTTITIQNGEIIEITVNYMP